MINPTARKAFGAGAAAAFAIAVLIVIQSSGGAQPKPAAGSVVDTILGMPLVVDPRNLYSET